jgi:hypothetical protein
MPNSAFRRSSFRRSAFCRSALRHRANFGGKMMLERYFYFSFCGKKNFHFPRWERISIFFQFSILIEQFNRLVLHSGLFLHIRLVFHSKRLRFSFLQFSIQTEFLIETFNRIVQSTRFPFKTSATRPSILRSWVTTLALQKITTECIA